MTSFRRKIVYAILNYLNQMLYHLGVTFHGGPSNGFEVNVRFGYKTWVSLGKRHHQWSHTGVDERFYAQHCLNQWAYIHGTKWLKALIN